MPEAGDYLFSNVGFSRDNQPFLSLQREGQFIDLAPFGKTVTLHFHMTQRCCIGWGDMTTSERFVCPDRLTVDNKYEQCSACQQRTGFNPAFYHATSVSKQQEARNLQPHMLYLAHFGEGIVKVGISYAARGNSRLLEQGARAAVILETFPSALIARQYEARIAALPGIVETIQLRKKIDGLTRAYDSISATKELDDTRTRIEQSLGIEFAKSEPLLLDSFYFPDGIPDLGDAHDCSPDDMLSGKVVGMLGSLLFCMQQKTPLLLPLKKYVGYGVTVSYDETEIALPARQISLFP